MGRLTYSGDAEIKLDDRVLAHLQLVIGTKLRRGESFYFSWSDEPAAGGGRGSFWMDPSRPLRFRYDGGRQPTLNHQWVELLMQSANSTAGLTLLPEPADQGHPRS